MFKKNILISVIVVCVVAVAGYGISKNINNDVELESLSLGNVEALANGEGFWDGVRDGLSWWTDASEILLKDKGGLWMKEKLGNNAPIGQIPVEVAQQVIMEFLALVMEFTHRVIRVLGQMLDVVMEARIALLFLVNYFTGWLHG